MFDANFFAFRLSQKNYKKMAKGSSSKKNAKGRLDKFYHLAKDQGYRARSAFKLIQLNKKYNFLEKAKCVVDLCAAPGGWLQVSQKYMPKPSLIIGLDLEKIKPIPGVITHVEDITSASCRTTLKRDLKTWKADVFLHDGAPNVGVSWLQDAFSQNELVLSSCKLATEFLVPGGTFVTKVFRSKDYNKLMWIFNQLFSKVEATKPTASRNVSAEIFVVCRGYLAPKKIDPRLLDPKFAFKEMDDTVNPEETDLKKIKAAQGQVLNDLMHPEKQKRHRDGYEEGATTLYVTNPVLEFIKSSNFLSLLAGSSALVFEAGNEESQKIMDSSLTTVEIKEFLKDLKVLGKKEFRELIKWRNLMRILIGLSTKTKVKEEVVEEPKPEMDIETLIENEKAAQQLKNKKEKKRQRERKQKLLLKLKLGMDTPQDISQGDLEGLPEFDMGDGEEPMEIDPATILRRLQNKNADKEEDESSSESEYLDSDDELILKVQRLDNQMDEMYEEFEKRRIERNPSQKVKKVKEASAAFEEWYGIGEDAPAAEKTEKAVGEYDSDSGSSSDEEDMENDIDVPMNQRKEDESALSKKAKLFFDNPVFDGLKSYQDEDSMFKDELVMHHKSDKNAKRNKNEEDEDQKGFEIVAATDYVEPARVSDGDSDDENTRKIFFNISNN